MTTSQAVVELAAQMPSIGVTRVQRGAHTGRFRIRIKGSSLSPTFKTPAHTLAFLADLALILPDSDGVREQVGWGGPAPKKGMAAWEESALRWLAS